MPWFTISDTSMPNLFHTFEMDKWRWGGFWNGQMEVRDLDICIWCGLWAKVYPPFETHNSAVFLSDRCHQHRTDQAHEQSLVGQAHEALLHLLPQPPSGRTDVPLRCPGALDPGEERSLFFGLQGDQCFPESLGGERPRQALGDQREACWNLWVGFEE